MKYETALTTPYPSTLTDQPNYSDARCLVESYGGRTSETTAVLTYIYQHYILADDYPDIADLMLDVAITEMHHHELLGEAIVHNGGDPVIGGLKGFWNGSYVNYAKNVKTILIKNIAAEKAAIRDYLLDIKCVKSTELKQLIQRIILDEELHIALFEEALASLC